jgi:hypothetical protein
MTKTPDTRKRQAMLHRTYFGATKFQAIRDDFANGITDGDIVMAHADEDGTCWHVFNLSTGRFTFPKPGKFADTFVPRSAS